MSFAAFVALCVFAGVMLGVSIGWRMSKGLAPIKFPKPPQREEPEEPEIKTERRKL